MFRKYFSVLILISLLLSPTIRSESHTAINTSSTSASTVKVDDLLKFQGLPVEEDVPGAKSWDYIPPNEHSNHLFEPCLPKEGGAYVAVGTMRGTNVASSGKVSHLFLMDFNLGAKVFNLANLQLISKAANRLEYLSLLLTGEAQPELEQKVRSGELKMRDFLSQLSARKLTTTDLLKTWEGMGIQLPEEIWKEQKKGNITGSSSLISSMLYELTEYENLDYGNNTFWGNDTRFETIQRMIAEKRVTVLNGDITGDKAVRSIGEVLREKNMKLAGFDASNILSWFAQTNEQDRIKKFLDKVKELPFAEGGRLYITAHAMRPDTYVRHDMWNYYGIKPESLGKIRELVEKKTPRGSFFGWPESLADENFMPVDPSNHPGRKQLRTLPGEECK
jgi:hypothetical protein